MPVFAVENGVKGTAEADQLLADGHAAFKRKYRQMKPSLLLIAD